MAPRSHIPVLLSETIGLLAPQPGETILDCTAGLGGHAAALAQRIGTTGTLILFDLDAANLRAASERIRALPNAPRVLTHRGSFADAPRLISSGDSLTDPVHPPSDIAYPTSINILLADLGFASPQVDDPARGFSFMREGPLDMRLNPQAPISAGELVNSMAEQELMELIRDIGEEPQNVARRIAAKVVQERKVGPILTTVRLAEIVRSAVPTMLAAGMRIHPATKTFQALRIAVNDEIGSLERLLDSIGRAAAGVASGKESWLAPGDTD